MLRVPNSSIWGCFESVNKQTKKKWNKTKLPGRFHCNALLLLEPNSQCGSLKVSLHLTFWDMERSPNPDPITKVWRWRLISAPRFSQELLLARTALPRRPRSFPRSAPWLQSLYRPQTGPAQRQIVSEWGDKISWLDFFWAFVGPSTCYGKIRIAPNHFTH